MVGIGNRKLNRLSKWDYSSGGYYFVTICAGSHGDVFGEVVDGNMILNEYGRIVWNQGKWMADRYFNIKLDSMIVMPDHWHGIVIVSNVGNGRDRSVQKINKSLPSAIGAFKTTSSKLIHRSGNINFKWQKSYHDRIIRNSEEYERIRKYIRNNPINWKK